jgi:hypothetical protein
MYHPRIVYPQMNPAQPTPPAVPAHTNAGEQEWATP